MNAKPGKVDLAGALYAPLIQRLVLGSELAGALLLIPGIRVRWVSFYAIPMMLGAAHFWAARNGFWFVAAGAELPIMWCLLLVLQAMLGDGPYALRAGKRVSG